jgi:hypothetical protein
VLFKTLAVYAATTGAVGHLISLRKVSDSEQAIAEIEVLRFLILPPMPLPSMLYHTWQTGRLGLRRWQAKFARSGKVFVRSAMLYVSACLGARATSSADGTEQPEGADSILLHQIALSDRIISKTREFSLCWLGRLILLAALLAQAVAKSIHVMCGCLHDYALTPY